MNATNTHQKPFEARSFTLRMALVFTVIASLLTFVPGRANAAANTLDLRVLVVSADGSEPAIAAWTSQLKAEGVPFDLLIATEEAPITLGRLVRGSQYGRYQAIVMASADLVSCNSNGCASTVTQDELTALSEYQKTFGIRQVSAYVYPTPSVGLNYPTSSGDMNGVVASLTVEGKSTFPYLNGQVPIEHSYGYLSTPNPGTGETFTNLVSAPTGQPLVGVYKRLDGREEMVVTVDSNPWVINSKLLTHGMLRWVTKDVYLGLLRNNFSVHVDDVFLPDDRWDVNANTTHEDDGATVPLIRMTAADVERLRTWQNSNNLKLDMTFNGGGSDEHIEQYGSDPLTTAMLANRSEFRWLNHTFSHLNLDNESAAVIKNEIKANRTWAKQKKVTLSSGELVTGEHSGLNNPAMPGALNKAGIVYIASDNSRTPNQTKIGPAFTVPRHPTNIYYNTATREEQLDEYNYLYYENCTNTATTTCLSAPATWDEYVGREATIMLGHVLGNDVRPHYVHQGNIAEDGVLYDVLDQMLGRYRNYLSTPLVQPTLSEAGKSLTRRDMWANAIATNKVQATITGNVVRIRPMVNLDIPLTAPNSSRIRTVNANGTIVDKDYGDEYGGLSSAWTSVRANKSLVITLTP